MRGTATERVTAVAAAGRKAALMTTGNYICVTAIEAFGTHIIRGATTGQGAAAINVATARRSVTIVNITRGTATDAFSISGATAKPTSPTGRGTATGTCRGTAAGTNGRTAPIRTIGQGIVAGITSRNTLATAAE